MKKNHLKLKGISEDQFVFCHLINNSNLIHVVSVIMIRICSSSQGICSTQSTWHSEIVKCF